MKPKTVDQRRADRVRRLGSHLGSPGVSSPAQRGACRIFDLPGVPELEQDCLFAVRGGGPYSPTFRERLDKTSFAAFGVTYSETEFQNYAATHPIFDDDDDWDEKREEYEEQFVAYYLPMDEDRAAYMRSLGFDFFDGKGVPLMVTKWLCRQAEAAAKGIMGHMPRQEDLSLRRFDDAMSAEAQRFMASRRSSAR